MSAHDSVSQPNKALARDEQRKYTFKVIRGAIRSATAFVVQAQLVCLAEANVPSFVAGAEGAPADCGILLDDEIPASDPTHRLFETLAKYGDAEALLPMDVKTIHAIPSTKGSRGGLYGYRLGHTDDQMKFAAFIVMNISAPDHVAVIPLHYLFKDSPVNSSQRRREHQFWETPILEDRDVPFPSEMLPFVMPIEQLPAALEIARQFAKGELKYWSNPYNGLRFITCPKPIPMAVSLLRPSEANRITDLPVQEDLWRRFAKQSSSYGVRRLHIQPGVGDFEIVHLETGLVMNVEIKQTLVRWRGSFSISHSRVTHVKDDSPHIFTPVAQWDALYSTFAHDRTTVFFCARDELPDEWFQPSDSDDDRLTWTLAPATRARVIFSTKEDSFITKLEAVLDDLRAKGKFQSSKLVEILSDNVDDTAEALELDSESLLPMDEASTITTTDHNVSDDSNSDTEHDDEEREKATKKGKTNETPLAGTTGRRAPRLEDIRHGDC